VSAAAASRRGLALAGVILGAWALSLSLALFFYPLHGWALLGAPLIMALHSWLFVGLFIVAHDCMHGSLAPGRPRLNEAVGRLCLFLYAGFEWRKAYTNHHAHHRGPGGDTDPDFHASSRFWPWYRSFLLRYFSWRNVAFVASVLTGLVALGAPLANVILFWALPAIASSAQLFAFGTYLPHRREETGFPDAHNARSNAWPELASLFTCYHFGYHHEHHLHPGAPWWRLPEVRRGRLHA